VIPEEKIAEVRESAKISDFISPYVDLKRKGRAQMGLCPFHSEKTPSFSVNDENGFFHCFGCGASGDVFKFLTEVENLSFPESVRKVAERYGISVPDVGGGMTDSRAPFYEANASAARYFHRFLLESEHALVAREYLDDRGLTREAIDAFNVGAAPTSGTGLVKWLMRESVDVGTAIKLGLVVERGGRTVDRFRNRIMFPIRDGQGRVIGFGGRQLVEGEGPKYLNSSESEVYRKSRALYGIFEARDALRATEHILLVEGYLDVIALAQVGVRNVVATCGTALTGEQARLMSRYAGEVVTLFDADGAGATAAARSFLPIFFDAEIWARGAILPAGEDPDSFVRAHGPDALRAAVTRAEPLVGAYVRYVVENAPPGDAGLARAGAELAGLLARVTDRFKYEQFVKKVAYWTELPEAALRRASRDAARAQPAVAGGERRQRTRTRLGAAGPEELLVTVLLTHPASVARVTDSAIINSMEEGVWRDVVDDMIGMAREGRSITSSDLIDRLPDDLRDRVARELTQGTYADSERRDRALDDCIKRIHEAEVRRHNRQVISEMRRREALGTELEAASELANLKSRKRPNA
jgi:DNA primase